MAAALGAFLLVAPLGAVAHRLVPSPQRVAIAVGVTALLAPFFVTFQALVRRGDARSAIGWSVAGHALVLCALAAGVLTGLLPEVVGLALPLLALAFALVEVFGATAHARTGNSLLVGVVEAVWIAGLAAVAMPLP